jgi:hypothetical protein
VAALGAVRARSRLLLGAGFVGADEAALAALGGRVVEEAAGAVGEGAAGICVGCVGGKRDEELTCRAAADADADPEASARSVIICSEVECSCCSEI